MSSFRIKPYEFSRGSAEKPENSWDCMGRLAEETQWYRFMSRGELWFVSADWMFERQEWIYRLTEEAPGVLKISFKSEVRIDATECNVTVASGRYAVVPGMVVRIAGEGAGDGDWVVFTVRRSWQEHHAELTLKRKRPKLPEPAPEVEKITVASSESEISGAAAGGQSASNIRELSDKVRQAVPGLQVTSTFRPGGTSYHGKNRAHDLAGSTQLMDKASDFISQSGLWQSLVEGIYNSQGRGHDLSVKNQAKTSPPAPWGGATWAGHANHLHLAV